MIKCPICSQEMSTADKLNLNNLTCTNCRSIFSLTDTDRRPDSITHTFRDPLLVERRKTHGDFKDNARISQQIKSVFVNAYDDLSMCPEHCEALDMIALKLSRILSGQANYQDHWDDIAGYAKLASEACQKS